MTDTIQTSIYVGLSDSETHKQQHLTGAYINILRKVCQHYKVPFSADLNGGGYYHEDGSYVEEKSIVLTLIGADSDTVEKIATDLCTFFHQESVMIVETDAKLRFVGASSEE